MDSSITIESHTRRSKNEKKITTFETRIILLLQNEGRWLKGNDIKTGSTKGSDYWAAYVVEVKIKTDGPKQHTGLDVITH